MVFKKSNDNEIILYNNTTQIYSFKDKLLIIFKKQYAAGFGTNHYKEPTIAQTFIIW